MKRALITGGAKRLGHAMARFLAERGIGVAVHYNSSESEAETLVKGLRTPGCALQADLLDESATHGLIARAAEGLGGPIDLLINNASIFEYDTIRTATRESWDRHFGSNLRAPYVLTQTFAEQAPKATCEGEEPRANALIVNIIDQRVRRLTPEFSTYTLAKSALWTLTQTAAMGLAPDIRVNAIGPGPTLQGSHQSHEAFAAQRRATILRRGSDPDGICAALGYFIDAPAVTGQLLCVDGGQHLAWETPDICRHG